MHYCRVLSRLREFSLYCESSDNDDCDGVVLLETIIVFLLLVTLTASIVDFWKLLRDADSMLTASRHGARVAAAQAHQAEIDGRLPSACGDML